MLFYKKKQCDVLKEEAVCCFIRRSSVMFYKKKQCVVLYEEAVQCVVL